MKLVDRPSFRLSLGFVIIFRLVLSIRHVNKVIMIYCYLDVGAAYMLDGILRCPAEKTNNQTKTKKDNNNSNNNNNNNNNKEKNKATVLLAKFSHSYADKSETST